MRRLIILFIILFSFSLSAQQRYFKLGLKEGATTSQVSGDTYSGFDKFGYVGGGYVKAKIGEKWDFAFEIIFIQKGSRHRADFAAGDFNNYFLQLNYVEVPLIFSFYVIKDLGLEFGPSIGFLAKPKELINLAGIEYDGVNQFNAQEVSFNIGVSHRFYSRFGIHLRYTNSLLSIRDNVSPTLVVRKWPSNGQYNSLIALSLTYEYNTQTKKKY